MAEINTNLDTTPLPPNNLVAQDPVSAELAGYVRTKTFGRDVRESIARSIELNSTRSKSAEILANETVNVANDLTDRFNQQIGALTEDSEVIDARGGKTTLGQRLDETDAHLAQTDTFLTEQVTHVTNLSSLTENELRLLGADYNTHLHLNLDVDLVISGEPIAFSNTTFRTSNGSKVVINDSSLVLQDNTDFQGLDVDARNSPTKPNIIIKRSPEAVSGYINRITIDNIYIEGHPDFTANAFEIHGNAKGMIGIMVRNIYTRDHNIIFDFWFEDSDAWTNANVFENVFSQRMKQMVKYSPYGPSHPAGTHFTSNLFHNVGGNGSSIYLGLAHDLGLNRYIDCFVYDLEIYNNKPELDRVGNIWGINNNPFLMQNPETPKQLVIKKHDVVKLGYFDNLKGAPLEAFLKLSFMKPGIGLECIIWLNRDAAGKLVVRSNSLASSGWYKFYTHTTPQGSLAVFMQYTGVGWVRPTYHERNDFTIDHQGGMKYTKAEIDAIGATELIEAVRDANIF